MYAKWEIVIKVTLGMYGALVFWPSHAEIFEFQEDTYLQEYLPLLLWENNIPRALCLDCFKLKFI